MERDSRREPRPDCAGTRKLCPKRDLDTDRTRENVREEVLDCGRDGAARGVLGEVAATIGNSCSSLQHNATAPPTPMHCSRQYGTHSEA